MLKKKVVVYARVSSREQEREGFSIPAQLKLLREYACKNGYEIVKEYSDAETAKKTGRTNYNAMLEYLKNNDNIKIVLVEKTDRLYRNFKDYVTLEDYDLEIHLVKEGSIISKNSKSHDKFIHGIKVLMAKNYIDNLSEEISKGLKEGLEQGYWLFLVPYGYKRAEKKTLCIDNGPALFVRRAFELFSSGKYSLRKLSEKLLEDGYYYKPERPKITPCVLESMLKNVIYVGQMSCNGVIYQGKHPAIIQRALFDKVQNAFRGVDRSKVRKNFDFLYPAVAKCGICGYSICGERQKKRHVYYRCSHYDRTCPNTSYLSEKEFTFSLRKHLRRIALDENLYELIKFSLKESFGDEEKYHQTEIMRLNSEIEQTKQLLKKIYLDQLNNSIDYELWVNLKNEYETKLNKFYAQLQKHTQAHVGYLEVGVKLLDVCLKASKKAKDFPDYEVANTIRETAQSVTMTNKKLKVVFKEPFSKIEQLIRYN